MSEKFTALSLIDRIMACLAPGGPGKAGFLRPSKMKSFPTDVGVRSFFFGKKTDQKGPWKLLGDSSIDALYFTRSVLEVLYDGVPKFSKLPWRDQLSLFEVAREWQPHLFVKYAKYFTVWPMARYLSNPLPEEPDGWTWHPLIFKGAARRVLKNRLVSHNRKNDSLWFGILQGVKRGCAVVSESFVQESYKKHHKQMCTDPPEVPEEWYETFSRYCKLLFEKMPLRPATEKLFEASNSASYSATRESGGARAWIRREALSEYENIPNMLQTDSLIAMIETRPGMVEEVRGRYCPSWNEVLEEARKEPRAVMVSAVLEPLKVRLITKGPAHRMWVSRFLQKHLWQYMQRFPCFSLTGKTMDISDVWSLKCNSEDVFPGYRDWVSGDYSAATDGLNINCTKILFEEILEHTCPFDDEDVDGGGLKDILRSVLYEQTVDYPDPTIGTAYQQNGQLMGSILSFPILCLINMICYWISVEEDYCFNPDYSLHPKQLPVLVNGDDILFKTSDSLYKVWQKNIKNAGFTLSLGKNYVHRKYLTVNSRLFYDGEHLREVDYMNVGLLTGQSKLTGRSEVKTLPIWDYFNYSVPGSQDTVRARERFFHYQKEWIHSITRGGNYNCFVSPEHGGLGFQPIGEFYVTSFQRRLATLIDRRVDRDILERKFPRLALGLVRESKTIGPPTYYDGRQLKRTVTIGPLLETESYFEERSYQPPPLCYPVVDSELKFRPVRNLGELRSGCFVQMSDEDLDRSSRVVFTS